MRLGVFVLTLFLFASCVHKPSPIPQTTSHTTAKTTPHPDITKPKPKKKSPLTQENLFALKVNAPADARIRILNIGPKYHHNIQLKKGKYLIEVTKKGYRPYKKWVNLTQPLTLHVKLTPIPKQTAYALTWEFHNEKFYTLFDTKTRLIWALQAPYVDYVRMQNPKKVLKNTLFVTGKQIPKIKKSKLDTIVYAGNLKHNNAVVLLKHSRLYATKERLASLNALHVNGITHSWRVPQLSTLRQHNPFKKYQKYFEMLWERGNIIKANVAVLGERHHTLITLRYAQKKRLYEGEAHNGASYLQNTPHIALLIPVRKPSSKEDEIIYTSKESFFKRHKKLSVLLGSQQKALQALLGDPKISHLQWDAKKHLFHAQLFSTTAPFAKKITFSLAPNYTPTQFAQAILSQRVVPRVQLHVKANELSVEAVEFVPNRQKEADAYKEAKKSHSINAYREFLRLYPYAPQAAKIQQLLTNELKDYR